MNVPAPRSEKKSAIENCIRSFLIKSIHAIVQARNGNTYTSNCISAVGPRNNLMINIEEDPEIGAAIKQTFDPGFPVRVGDLLSLEILTSWAGGCRMIVEVWQFCLDTAERLDRASTPGPRPECKRSSLPGNIDLSHTAEVVIEDSRFFEKLGTLLKTLVVFTRLLPAYQLARRQGSTDYKMCYILRRGASDLERLGPGMKSQQVGRLFSGLAYNETAGSTAASSPPHGESKSSTDQTRKIYLNASVHYRTYVQPGPNSPVLPLVEGIAKLALPQPDEFPRSRDHPNSRRSGHHKHTHQARQSPRVMPAFADTSTEQQDEDDFDSAGALLSHICATQDEDDYRERLQDQFLSDDSEDDDVDLSRDESGLADRCSHSDDDDDESDGANEDASGASDDQVQPDTLGLDGQTTLLGNAHLQAAFSNLNSGSAHQLGRLFVYLREQADLDLFKVPVNTNAQNSTARSSAKSAKFNANALSDELERHEKTLKEFDDFLAEFCSIDLFGPEVRQLAPPVQPR